MNGSLFSDNVCIADATRKKLLPGAIPTLNLPQKTFETETKPRREIVRLETDAGCSSTSKQSSKVYQHLNEFKRKVAAVKLSGWSRKEYEQHFVLEYADTKHALPVYSVTVDSGLGFSVAVFGWFLPDDHELYLEHKRSLFYVTISTLCNTIQSFSVCSGLEHDMLEISAAILTHSVPLLTEEYDEDGPPFQSDMYTRSNDCFVLCSSDQCSNCLNVDGKSRKKSAPAKPPLPVKDRAPLAACSKERLIATIQRQRLECKDLKDQVARMSKDIMSNSIEIDKNLESDVLDILKSSDLKSSPHMDLFWQQQKKLLASPNFGRRYHPHLIRFCLSLHSKSPSAYRELATSGVLILPSERVLRDYRNYFKPKPGFNEENITRLKDMTIQLFDVQRYVVISFDEMKIQSDLVFDKHSNELIGFVDLGDEVSNVAAFDKPTTIATHVLAFMVRGIASDLKYILGYFSTENLTSYQIMPVFWKAVSILELSCNLWVCATVSDGASPNRKFYDLHVNLVGEDHSSDLIHRTVNLFAPSRCIYFFSDAPHLVKTARNCLFNSGFGKHTRLMWNGKELIWNHIAQLYHSDMEQALHQLPKLTPDHISLNSFSKMKVNLAVQVLSNTVALALRRHFESGEADETAKFCEMMNG